MQPKSEHPRRTSGNSEFFGEFVEGGGDAVHRKLSDGVFKLPLSLRCWMYHDVVKTSFAIVCRTIYCTNGGEFNIRLEDYRKNTHHRHMCRWTVVDIKGTSRDMEKTDVGLAPYSGPSRSTQIISRRQAIARGLLRYFTGRECGRGHLAERYISNKACIECLKERHHERYESEPAFRAQLIERTSERYWNDPEYRRRQLERKKKPEVKAKEAERRKQRKARGSRLGIVCREAG